MPESKLTIVSSVCCLFNRRNFQRSLIFESCFCFYLNCLCHGISLNGVFFVSWRWTSGFFFVCMFLSCSFFFFYHIVHFVYLPHGGFFDIMRCRSITCLNTCIQIACYAMGMALHAKKDIKKSVQEFLVCPKRHIHTHMNAVLFNWCMLLISSPCPLLSLFLSCTDRILSISWCPFLLGRFVSRFKMWNHFKTFKNEFTFLFRSQGDSEYENKGEKYVHVNMCACVYACGIECTSDKIR